MPICVMVGLLGKKPGVARKESENYGIRIVEPILEAMEMTYVLIESNHDVKKIVPAVEKAYKTSTLITFLMGSSPI